MQYKPRAPQPRAGVIREETPSRERANGGGSVPETSREGEVMLHVGGQIDRLEHTRTQLHCQSGRTRHFVGRISVAIRACRLTAGRLGELAFLVL